MYFMFSVVLAPRNRARYKNREVRVNVLPSRSFLLTIRYRFLSWGDAIAEYLRVPTVIYYDQHGKFTAVGAQTLDQATIYNAKEKGWVKYSLCIQLFCIQFTLTKRTS